MQVKKDVEPQGKLLGFFYKNPVGRGLLRVLIHPFISKIAGIFLDAKCSTFLIRPYVRKYQIDLSVYEPASYHSFNDFFTRKIRAECRPFVMDISVLVSPCDGKLTVYPIAADSTFPVKGHRYHVAELLQDKSLAAQFYGGFCFVFRLAVDDYHRYFYFDSGRKTKNIFIPGALHTVRPIALKHTKVFGENCREYTVIDTDHFGRVVQMEVGALMVGRICNYHQEKQIQRGEEKGKFEFGGSTVILLLQKNSVYPASELLAHTKCGWETEVHCGEKIGEAVK